MSIERRIREGFEQNAADLHPQVEVMLATVVSRTRRRVLLHRVSSVVAVAVVVVAAVTFGPRALDGLRSLRRVAPANSLHPSVTIPAFDQMAGMYSTTVKAKGVTAGVWTMQLRTDGTMVISAPQSYPGAVSGFQFDLWGDRFRTNAFIGDLCSGLAPGLYRWQRAGGELMLTPIQDDCAARVGVFSSHPWRQRS